MTCQEYPQGEGSGGVGRPSRRSSGTSSTFSSSSYSAYSSSTVTTALASLACFSSSSWDEFDPRGPSSSPSPSCTLIEDQLIAMLRMERNYTIRRLQCHEVCIATNPPLAAAAAAAVSSPHCKHRRIESAPSPKSVIPSSNDQHPAAAPTAASSTTRGGSSRHYRHVSNNDDNRNGSAPPSQQQHQQQQPQTRTMTNTCSSSSLPHDEWRRKICEWSYKVVDHFKFDREVVSVAMNYFDRYLSIEKETLLKSRFEQDHDDNDDEWKTPTRHGSCTCSTCLRPVDSRTFQLAAMTSLYLAIKLHAEMGVDDNDADAEKDYDMNQQDYEHDLHREGRTSTNHYGARRPSQQAQQPFLPRGRRRLRLCAFVELSRGQFSSRDITSMEMTLLHTLRWRVNPPTPAALVTNLLQLLPRHPSPTRFGLFGTNTTTTRHYDGGAGAGRNNNSIHAYRRDVQMNYDLVVHVLHELSRYLTELSVCLADVSGSCHYQPSDIAYASILVSMDMISTRALPMEMRYEFRRDVARVSSLASGDGGGGDYGGYDDTHGGSSSSFGAVNLVPKEDLKRRIRHSFLPEMLLLDSSSSANDGAQHQPQHPIAVARDAGLLDLSAFYDSAGIATTNAIIDGTNDNNDVGIVQEGQHDDDDEEEEEEVQYQAGSTSSLSTSSFKERKVSATSVIHGNDETERALKSARRGEGSSSPSRATRKFSVRGKQLAAAAAAAAATTAEEAKSGEALLAVENEECVSMTRRYCRETVLESASVTTSSVIGGRAVLSRMTATAEHEQEEHYTLSSRRPRRRRRRNGEYSSYGGRDY